MTLGEPVESSASREGAVLGDRYRICAHLASGGMGSVFEGEHLITRRRVAIKLLHQRFLGDTQMVCRFRREAINAAKLSSDFVSAVTDFGTAPDGLPFLVMELLYGESLRCRLKREHTLPPSVAAGLIQDACRAVAHAHVRGIIHRDLKPSNLFLERVHDGSVRVKLLDFGIAKAFAQQSTGVQTQAGRVMGTPPYMSPEQAAGQVSLDTRTDIFGLGLVLYETLAGRLPYTGRDGMALRAQIVRELPTPLDAVAPGLPPALVQLVHCALAPRAEDRFPSASAMAQALEPFVQRVSLPPSLLLPGFEGAMGGAGESACGAHQSGTMASAREAPVSDSGAHGGSAEAHPGSPQPGPSGRRLWTLLALTAGAALVVGVGLGASLVGVRVQPSQQSRLQVTPDERPLADDRARDTSLPVQPPRAMSQTVSPPAPLGQNNAARPSAPGATDEQFKLPGVQAEGAAASRVDRRGSQARSAATAEPAARNDTHDKVTERESTPLRAADTALAADRVPARSRPALSGVSLDPVSPYTDLPQ